MSSNAPLRGPTSADRVVDDESSEGGREPFAADDSVTVEVDDLDDVGCEHRLVTSVRCVTDLVRTTGPLARCAAKQAKPSTYG